MGNIELLEMELSEDERRDKYFEAMVTIQRKSQKIIKKDLTRFFCENAK